MTIESYLIDQVKCSMRYELIQMTMVLFLWNQCNKKNPNKHTPKWAKFI